MRSLRKLLIPVVTALLAWAVTLPAGATYSGQTYYLAIQQASPTVSAAAYATGQVMGGVLTFNAAFRSIGVGAYLNDVRLLFKTASQTASVDLLLFSRVPSGTYTDATTFALAAADIPYFLGRMQAGTVTSLGTGGTEVQSSAQPLLVLNSDVTPGTKLYGVLVVRGTTPTLSSTSDLTVTIGLEQQ